MRPFVIMDTASRALSRVTSISKLEGIIEEGEVHLRSIASVPIKSSARRRSSSVV